MARKLWRPKLAYQKGNWCEMHSKCAMTCMRQDMTDGGPEGATASLNKQTSSL